MSDTAQRGFHTRLWPDSHTFMGFCDAAKKVSNILCQVVNVFSIECHVWLRNTEHIQNCVGPPWGTPWGVIKKACVASLRWPSQVNEWIPNWKIKDKIISYQPFSNHYSPLCRHSLGGGTKLRYFCWSHASKTLSSEWSTNSNLPDMCTCWRREFGWDKFNFLRNGDKPNGNLTNCHFLFK